MRTEVSAPLTWHVRVVTAVAESKGCTLKSRRVPRIIGGRQTAKTNRLLRFVGADKATVEAVDLVEQLFGDLNVRSNAYARTLPEDATPNERRLARRAWLEREATKIAMKLTGGT